MKNRKLIALIAILAVLAVACGGSDTAEEVVEETPETTQAPATTEAPATAEESAASGDPLVLASLMPFSGDLASLGPGIALGAKVAVDQINALGGVNGQDIVYLEGDSGCNADVALTGLQDVIAQGAQGVMGAACSSATLALLSSVIEANVALVSPSSTSPQLTTVEKGGMFSRTAPSDAFQGVVLAAELVKDGIETISIISRADSYGRGLANATLEAFEAAGGTVANVVYHAADASEFSAEVTAVGKGSPDAIVAILFPDTTGCPIVQSAFEQGLTDIPWYFTDGVKDSATLIECSQGALEGFKGVAPGAAASDAFENFKTLYKAADGENETFIFAPQAYDAAMLMILSAIANGTDGESIAGGMIAASGGGTPCIGAECVELALAGEDFDYVGASGPIDLDANGDPTAGTYDIYQIQGSDYVVLETIDYP